MATKSRSIVPRLFLLIAGSVALIGFIASAFLFLERDELSIAAPVMISALVAVLFVLARFVSCNADRIERIVMQRDWKSLREVAGVVKSKDKQKLTE